jgi:hypothetical protein
MISTVGVAYQCVKQKGSALLAFVRSSLPWYCSSIDQALDGCGSHVGLTIKLLHDQPMTVAGKRLNGGG